MTATGLSSPPGDRRRPAETRCRRGERAFSRHPRRRRDEPTTGAVCESAGGDTADRAGCPETRCRRGERAFSRHPCRRRDEPTTGAVCESAGGDTAPTAPAAPKLGVGEESAPSRDTLAGAAMSQQPGRLRKRRRRHRPPRRLPRNSLSARRARLLATPSQAPR